jgi:hypothetical protein
MNIGYAQIRLSGVSFTVWLGTAKPKGRTRNAKTTIVKTWLLEEFAKDNQTLVKLFALKLLRVFRANRKRRERGFDQN